MVCGEPLQSVWNTCMTENVVQLINCLQISRYSSRKLQHSLTRLSVLRLLDWFFPHRYPISFCLCGDQCFKVCRSVHFIYFIFWLPGWLPNALYRFLYFSLSFKASECQKPWQTAERRDNKKPQNSRDRLATTTCLRVMLLLSQPCWENNSAPRCEPSSDCHAGVTPSR